MDLGGIYEIVENDVYEEFRCQAVATDDAVDYPSAKWGGDEKRPTCQTRNWTAPQVTTRLLEEARAGIVSDLTFTTFLHRVIAENQAVFTHDFAEPWIFRGQVLIAAGRGSPLNLLAWGNPIVEVGDAPANHDGNDEERLRIFWAVIMLYRKALAKGINDEHAIVISNRLDAHFRAAPFSVPDATVNQFVGLIEERLLTTGYRMIISALDMYFYKMRRTSHASLRIATMGSRYRGCVSLTSISSISRMLGMGPEDLAEYVYTAAVQKEIKRIMKTDQSMDDEFGYFPYQVEMGLVLKSAYSMTVNPTLHLWLHTIGSTWTSQRSLLARVGEAADVPGTVSSAVAFALNFSNMETFTRRFVRGRGHAEAARNDLVQRRNQERGQPEERMVEVPNVGGGEHSRRSNDILANIIYNNGLSPGQMRLMVEKVGQWGAMREGTVGHFLHNHFIANPLAD